MDMIFNGQVTGPVANRLLASNFDTRVLRPFIGADGRSYVTVTNARGQADSMPVGNAYATLRKDDWQILDDVVTKVGLERLRGVGDLRAAGLVYNIPNGMSKTVLQTESMSDINPASVSMDGLRESANDRTVFELTNLPLPIIHKDFHFSARQLATSRNGGSPLDTTMAEAAARKVAEEAERLLVGNSTTADQYAYGGGTIYGLTDFGGRITRVITAPTASGWTGSTLLDEVLAMMQDSRDAFHYGPWVLYMAPAWARYTGNDFKDGSDKALRSRLLEVDDLNDIRTLDYLTGYTMVLVQQTSDVIREVIGMDLTTVQWESFGGMQINFKVMAIMVPQIRADQNGNTGIVHAAPAT